MTDGLEDMPVAYKVQAQDLNGKFASDPYANYDRGRRRVELNEAAEEESSDRG